VNFRSKSSRSLRFNNEAKRKFSLQFRLDFRNFASLHVASRRIAFAKRRLFHCLTIQPSLLRAENLNEEELKIRAEKEFDTIIHVWIKYARSIDWLNEFRDQLRDSPKAGEEVDSADHLLPLNIGKLYIQAHQSNKYGYLPLMASSSKGQLGALIAESYCERVISVGNMISTDRNVVLNDDELEMLVVLKMNKDLIQFMRTNYATEIKKTSGQRFNESSASG